ncbi:hypothetical protein FSP39_004972 [Pinctada imbricata]|uniref:Uncharacterized protein n=1 Tax=Pinctada imbricata TaxID=66713 RepID=A0AA88Y4X8_PINIB|nr:hypothetical protein FSP39_004972 [Pinctada imbricata]
MAGESVAGNTFKRSRQAVTLNSRATVKVDDDNIHVDPQLLFQRLTTISRVISVLFDYELAAYPSSLFESSGLPREAQKSSLATAIWSLGDFAANIDSGGEYVYVLDGGSLIHKIPWEQKASFGSIIDSYTNYVLKKFGHATIVFDGYPNHPTTKDITHIRRSKGICGRKVIISNVTTLNTKKEHFLANTDNKKQFISHLSLSLQQSGCEVLQARDDADTLIVETAINKSTTAHVAVIGEDTDLLVLLINRFDPNSENDILFYSERRTKDHKVWNIRKASSVLPREICRNLPLIHAITCCDTTSRVFGIGKTHAIKKFIQTPALNSSATMFLDVNASKANIASAGESIVCSLFAGMPSETLNQLRYRKFVTKTVSWTSFIQVHELPPTAAANHFHSLRTCHQVQMWTGNELNPLEYGWKEDGGKLLPIKTILPAAPDDLLKVLRRDLVQAIRKKRPYLAANLDQVTLHQDNAPAHKSRTTQLEIDLLGFQCLQQPPYSPDLAPMDLVVFPYIKSFLRGQKFDNLHELRQEVLNITFRMKSEHFVHIFDDWLKRHKKCLELNGDYVEKN